MVEGCPDFKLCAKLEVLKQKLKIWSKFVLGEHTNRGNTLLQELAELDLAQDNRVLTEDEMVVKATILVELEVLAKNEESTWRQKSRILWLKNGDNNTRFFQRMTFAHRRYNTINRLVSYGVEIKELGEVKMIMIEFYNKLYTKSEP
ncbi:hypothetical protein MTR67_002849 [Solanum verrucosum]|uniref:Uncharacterized protein n=2 Tax=Solanum verrucosum TaxID=315347 RepID=A0AAF0PQY7_SOLVR|nr:hypothetical protein MTR67_002849 [Solanum verrucosum]